MSTRQIMSGDEIQRALTRIGHEIVEKHGGTADLALVGIERRGPELAARIADIISARYDAAVPVAAVDANDFRDDAGDRRPLDGSRGSARPQVFSFELSRSTVVLVDDVLFTGRTVRAAIEALIVHGRPAAVRLAVLIDRGHRELPVRADHVGKNVPTARDEHVEVHLGGSAGDYVRIDTGTEMTR